MDDWLAEVFSRVKEEWNALPVWARPVVVQGQRCKACLNWNHWHDTPGGLCDDPRCECEYRP
jgi:hypothetical protein